MARCARRIGRVVVPVPSPIAEGETAQCRRRHFVVYFILSLSAQKVVGSKDLLSNGVDTKGANFKPDVCYHGIVLNIHGVFM